MNLALCSSTSTNIRVAVVGGGITGAVAASVLSQHFQHVSLYDQGRRGIGGRASHRSVVVASQEQQPEETSYEFDHGCQFFRADTPVMQDLVRVWRQKGWVAPWEARLGRINNDTSGGTTSSDFFGVPSRPEAVYIGVGGMHQLPRRILQECPQIAVHRGTRVSGVERNDKGEWQLRGVSGEAAFHDSKTQDAQADFLETVDAVLFTDRSSAFGAWHRASAGIPQAFQRGLDNRVRAPRVPLFSCMVALSHPVRSSIPYDAFTVDHTSSVNGESSLWFAACSQSKPGFPVGAAECWTLISTPAFAVEQIQETPMQDPVTGAFRPQENDYLNKVPGPLLWNAFCEAIRPSLEQTKQEMPEAVYLQAQRWGSGLPAPSSVLPEDDAVVQVCGVDYAKQVPSLVYERPKEVSESDFVADDNMALFAAGDFTSHRYPGFEAAALSGLDVAQHMVESLRSERSR